MTDLSFQMIANYAAALWRKRWYAIVAAYAVGIAGWISVSMLPERYESHARIYVDTDNLLSPLLRGISVEDNVAQRIEVVQRTLLSRPNLEQLIRMADLDLFFNGQSEKEALVASLGERISVSGGAGMARNLFTVKFADSRPEVAQRVVQSLLSIFVESHFGQSRGDIERARKFINAQISEYEHQLQIAEARVTEFKKKNIEYLGNATTSFTQQLEQLRLQKDEIAGQISDARSRRESLQRDLDETPRFVEFEATVRDAPIIIDTAGDRPSSAVAALLGHISAAEKALDAMLLRFTGRHPDVIAVERQLASLKEQLEQQKNSQKENARGTRAVSKGQSSETRGGVFNEPQKQSGPNPVYQQFRLKLTETDEMLEALRRRSERVAEELAIMENRGERAAQVELEFSRLSRDYAILKKNYDELTVRRESARITDAVEANGDKMQFRIVDPPQVPSLPSGPPRFLLVACVFGAAVAGGLAVAFCLSQMDQTFVLLRDLKQALPVPVLGSVTLLETTRDRRLATIDAFSFAASIAVLAFGCLALLSAGGPLSTNV